MRESESGSRREGARASMDAFAVKLAEAVIRRRWLIIGATVVLAAVTGSGARFLDFATNYRAFFSDENPELVAFENFQNTYTKNDNILFVVQPREGGIFTNEVTSAVEQLTAEAWKIPYAIRVDSISNFQHTWSEEDDLTVEDLIVGGATLSEEDLTKKRAIALAEPLIANNLLSADAATTGINVVLQYPEKSLAEVPEAAAKARQIKTEIESKYPDLTVAITGVSMLNNTFAESGIRDMSTLVPVMYLTLLVVMILSLRTLSGTFASLAVIMLSTITAMGIGGFLAIELTPISMTAPTVILTLAIADSVHILISLRSAMKEGLDKAGAIVEAIRINFLPVSITSVTTIVGFLALNFSDSPPFNHLGNITAVGIGAAWVYSVTFLPALMSLLPVGFKAASAEAAQRATPMERIADFAILRYRGILLGMGTLAVALSVLAPTNDLNDEWTKYFSKSVTFRQDTDFALEHLGGLYPIEFSVGTEGPGGVSGPAFLAYLEEFTAWLREQPDVTHVYSLTDIMKRLNMNMHGDDRSYYRVPGNRELAAQYLLLYELSLPYGLDLNDRINIDKSATRVTATLGDVSTVETRAFVDRAEQWLRDNTPRVHVDEAHRRLRNVLLHREAQYRQYASVKSVGGSDHIGHHDSSLAERKARASEPASKRRSHSDDVRFLGGPCRNGGDGRGDRNRDVDRDHCR